MSGTTGGGTIDRTWGQRDPRFESLRSRRVCVTGGAGFIGSHLCAALAELGADLCILDDMSNGRRENIAPLLDRATFIEGSILDADALAKAIDGAEAVFHLAAMGSVPLSVEKPQRCFEINTEGTQRVLEAARTAGVKRFIFAASSSAYGNRTEMPLRETLAPLPLSPYAASKCAGEELVAAYAQCYEMAGVSLRYFNIFGPRQRPDSQYAAVIPKFIDAMLAGRRPMIFGDGSQTRDFTHVANAVYANLLAATCAQPLAGEVVNIACGDRFGLLELVDTLAELLDVDPAREFAPPRLGDVPHSQASIEAARALLGYAPIVDFHAGLHDTVAAMRHTTTD